MDFRERIILFLPLAIIVTALLLFVPAGSFDYWNAWVFMVVLFTPFLFTLVYLVRHDPGLLERRMKFNEKKKSEQIIVRIAQAFMFIGILIPGLDYRYGWSSVPLWLVIMSDILIFSGYMIVFSVFKVNTYTSRIVEVEKGQKVITIGPYTIVRHPMYAGIIIMYFFIPLALGSYYALLLFIPSIIMIFFRILDEEKLLSKELKGYKEYTKKVKYRLVPGVW